MGQPARPPAPNPFCPAPLRLCVLVGLAQLLLALHVLGLLVLALGLEPELLLLRCQDGLQLRLGLVYCEDGSDHLLGHNRPEHRSHGLASPCPLTKTVEEDVAAPNTLLDLNELQCHPGPNLATDRWEKSGQPWDWALSMRATTVTPHLCKSDGALLGLHVATTSHSLGQFCGIVFSVWLCLTF